MASGSSGHGSSARGGGPSAAAAAAAPSPEDSAFPGSRQLAHLPAVDLVGHLVRRDRRPSDFVDVAVVLSTRESRFAGVEARARAAEEAAARLRREMAVRKRVAAAVEERLQAEIRAWNRRAAEAEARLQLAAAYASSRDDISREHDDAPPLRWSLMWPADGSALSDEEEEAQTEEEEAPPLQVASGKRKEKAVASSPVTLSKKLKLRAWGGSCSNAVPESEADPTEEAEAEAEDPWPAWEEARDALAIIPGAGWCYLHGDAPPEETETKQQGVVGEHDQRRPEDKIGGEPEGFEHEPAENPVALAVVTPGNDLPPKDDDGVEEASRSAVPEPDEASEEINMTGIAGNGSLRNKGMIYKMVFKALKEKERQATLASASKPNLRFWLHAPLPEEPVAVDEVPDDADKLGRAAQQ